MHILCIFPSFRQGDFVEKARAPLVGYHFLYSHDLYVWLRGDIVRSNETLFSLRGHSSLLGVTGLRGWPPALFLFTSTILTPRWREGLLKEKYLAWQHKTMSPIRTYTFQPQVYEVNVNISLPLISLFLKLTIYTIVPLPFQNTAHSFLRSVLSSPFMLIKIPLQVTLMALKKGQTVLHHLMVLHCLVGSMKPGWLLSFCIFAYLTIMRFAVLLFTRGLPWSNLTGVSLLCSSYRFASWSC